MSNSLDPDQAQRIVGPDLGPNCLPRLSADDTGRQRILKNYTEAGCIVLHLEYNLHLPLCFKVLLQLFSS